MRLDLRDAEDAVPERLSLEMQADRDGDPV
jgi:hypothetical protein